MSGTSLDGVDVALIETDGERIEALGPTGYRPYSESERDLLRQALAAGVALSDRWQRPGVLAEADEFVTRVHAETVETFLKTEHIKKSDVDIVGFHGQTVLHRPAARLTVQIGNGEQLAARLGLPVAHDFRAADVAAGGQGAPLVPVFHQALARDLDRPHPMAVLNLGGVANVTFVDGGDPIACDTGPGNALIDDFMRARVGAPYDNHGDAAADGKAPTSHLSTMCLPTRFLNSRRRSRSTAMRLHSVTSDCRIIRLLTARRPFLRLQSRRSARIVPHLPAVPKAWIVAGGGARNRTLMKMLQQRLAPATVETADQAGWSSDALEAQAFAYLAVRTLNDLPITFPKTTGVAAPLTGGVVARP